MKFAILWSLVIISGACGAVHAGERRAAAPADQVWPQWRGPHRDGTTGDTPWPDRLAGEALQTVWRVPLGPSYSGPIVSETMVFVTETKDAAREIVRALDRQTGKQIWEASWKGAISVPFFAKSNGDWIRATPAFDGESLYVAGIRDVLVSLNATTGAEQWRVDFTQQFGSPVPAFGFVSSPLIDGDAIFVQAGASCCKLDRRTGKTIWRILKDDGGMMGSAFSSPVIATLAGRRQLLVQTREKLVGADPETGAILWEKPVPNFRGMNILTPVVVGDGIFTSTYAKKSWMFDISQSGGSFQVKEAWENNAQGYMSTPVVIDGYAYLHLQNQRFTCIKLATGERTWTSQPYGKYASLISRGDRILALDQRGKLLLLKANPQAFELIDERQITDQETWAHLALCGDELFVRELNAMSVFRWKDLGAK